MKDQRNKPKTVKSKGSAGKSIHTLYHELLDLREEVKDAQRRSPRRAHKVEKPAGKADRDL
jgi:hypothetical protein